MKKLLLLSLTLLTLSVFGQDTTNTKNEIDLLTSKLTTLHNKIAILDFFGSQGRISSYVKGFLTPDEELHQQYAERLGVDKEVMENIFEVCSVPDIYKETLYCSIPFEIDLFGNDNLLSLNK